MSNEEQAQERAMELARQFALIFYKETEDSIAVKSQTAQDMVECLAELVVTWLPLARLVAAEVERDELQAKHALRDIGFAGMVKQRDKLSAELSEAQKQFGLCSVCNKAAWVTRADGKVEDCEVCQLRVELEQMTADRNGVKLINEQHRETITKLRASNAPLDKAAESSNAINEGIAHYKKHYEQELESCETWIKWCEKRNDTHGINFHQGTKHALVWCNIILTHFLDACKSLTAYDQAEKGGGE